ncbi:hypothetical protein WJ438_39545 [Streptomyces sp. GD-15H]
MAQGVDLDLCAIFTLPRKVVGGSTAKEKLVFLAPSGSHVWRTPLNEET